MSIRVQAEADLNFDIIRAVRQQEPAIDFASAADAGLRPLVESIIVLWAVSDPAELRDHVYHLPSLIRHMFPS